MWITLGPCCTCWIMTRAPGAGQPRPELESWAERESWEPFYELLVTGSKEILQIEEGADNIKMMLKHFSHSHDNMKTLWLELIFKSGLPWSPRWPPPWFIDPESLILNASESGNCPGPPSLPPAQTIITEKRQLENCFVWIKLRITSSERSLGLSRTLERWEAEGWSYPGLVNWCASLQAAIECKDWHFDCW